MSCIELKVPVFHAQVPTFGQSTKVMEEFGEYVAAVTRYRKAITDGFDPDEVDELKFDVMVEWADVIQAMVNDADELGIDVSHAMLVCEFHNRMRGRLDG